MENCFQTKDMGFWLVGDGDRIILLQLSLNIFSTVSQRGICRAELIEGTRMDWAVREHTGTVTTWKAVPSSSILGDQRQFCTAR